jgi:hypothetical protein
MRTPALLIAVTMLLPLAWGWAAHRLVAKVWPRGGQSGPGDRDREARLPIPPPIYHI